MTDISGMFDLTGKENSYVDEGSKPEETLDRIFELRLAVAAKFGNAAMYDHSFFSEPIEEEQDRTPYRLACEGQEGLSRALHHLTRFVAR